MKYKGRHTRKQNHTWRTVAACLLCGLTLVGATPAFALETGDYSTQDIFFYAKSSASACINSSSGAESQGENKDYLGNNVFSEGELNTIKQYQPLYEQAVARDGYPWQLMAVIHYMETSLSRTNPANGQGLFQDFAKKYPELYTSGAQVDDATFLKQAARAVEILNGKVDGSGSNGMAKITKDDIKNKNPEAIKQLLLLYNGLGGTYYKAKAQALGYGNNIYEGSPYVMNRADAARDPSHRETMSSAWPGMFVADGQYDATATTTRYGTYVRFAVLSGVATASCATNGGGVVAGNILETAKNLAWSEPFAGRTAGSDWKSLAKPEFVAAVEKYNKSLLGDNETYADCGKFVSTVMHASGADPNYPAAGTSNQMAYVKDPAKNGGIFDIVSSPKKSDLRPGDILLFDGHTAIYGGDLGKAKSGQPLTVIEAAQDSRVPSWVPNFAVDWAFSHGGSSLILVRMKAASNV